MTESTETRGDLIQLDEETEGNLVGTGDFIFRKIGQSVPLKSSDSIFNLENAPVQALAISERFRVLFLAHSDGFYVVKTKDVIELAKNPKEKGQCSCIEESSILDVSIGGVSILALSLDSSNLAATVGGQIHLFSVPSLLRKESEPLSCCSLPKSSHAKELRWRKDVGNSYIVLSSDGILYHGDLDGFLKDIMENVDAVDWSLKGDYIIVARKSNISILSSEFKEQFRMSLMFQSWSDGADTNCIMKVDAIKWVRCDTIIIGCIQLTKDGKEEGYMVRVITKNNCDITEASSKPMVLSFTELFTGVVDSILPNGSGPYLFVSYLDRWELALAANRRNTDQHIVSIGWSLDDNEGLPVAVEFEHDLDVPRIELQASGEENLIVGFGVDKVSLYEKLEIKISDGEFKELSPYCILMCVTSEGKLSMFHVARMSDTLALPLVHSGSSGNVTGVEEDYSIVVPLECELSKSVENDGVQMVVSDGKLKKMSEEPLDIDKGDDKASPTRQEHGIGSQELRLSGRQSSNLTEMPMNLSLVQGLGSTFSGATKTGTQMPSFSPTTTVVDAGSLVGVLASETSPTRQPSHKDSIKSDEMGKGFEEMIGSNNFSSISSGSQSSGKLSFSNEHNARSSPFASIGSSQAHGYKNVGTGTGNASYIPAHQSSPSIIQFGGKSLKDSMFSLGRATQSEGQRTSFTVPGNVNSMSAIHSHQSSPSDNSLLVKSYSSQRSPLPKNSSAHQHPGLSSSNLESSESFFNVTEMAKELDTLLSYIEEDGGFRDACTVRLSSSVLELEEGLENLWKSCTQCKSKMDKQLRDIQNLQDKTVQEAIVEQASNSQYWELWNLRKLSPEFELKRRQIFKVHQNLMGQLIELERHFNTLELNKFGENSRVPVGRQTSRSLEPSRQIHSLQSLYNTMNSQLAAAEQLSESLLKQMAVLNIDSPPVKQQRIAKELFATIGLAYDGEISQSPDVKKCDHTRDFFRKFPLSSFSSIKEHSRRNTSNVLKGFEPESARRRRDSLDRSWASFEPQKTTVKRMLQEERPRVSASKLSLEKANESFSSQMEERFAFARLKGHEAHKFSSLVPSVNNEKTNLYPENKDSQRKPLIHALESPSLTLFKWAKDQSGALESGGSMSPSIPVIQRGNVQPPSSLSSSSSSIWNNVKKNLGSAESSDMGLTGVPQSGPSPILAHSFSETRSSVQSKTPPSQISLGVISSTLPTKSISSKRTANVTPQAVELSNLSGENGKTSQSNIPTSISPSGEIVSTVATPAFSLATPSSIFPSSSSFTLSTASPSPASTFSMTFGESLPTTKLGTNANQTVPSPVSLIASLLPPPSSFALQSQKTPAPPTTLSPPANATTEATPSPLKPSVSEPSSWSGSAISLAPARKVSDGLLSGSQPSSPALPLFQAPLSSTTTERKDESLDIISQEDDMEEEAPDTTELSLESLGGFGLGSAPAPSAPKPNPFGASFAVSPPSAPFTLTVPSGELFRPPSFSFTSSQPSQPMSQGVFSGGFGQPPQIGAARPLTASGFGQPAQIGAGQQALGSALGSFGQSRQLGSGLPGVGFASTGGFSSAATGAGFAGVATGAGGFAGAATGAGGFAGVAPGTRFGTASSGGFGAFSNNQVSGGFSSFGVSNAMATGKPAELFTQMRR
ncbi:nuclear pore complex protein isoform X2 [Tasmannia lanceolata]|uniref:nuclear pore complex protein isoform X2 n=1 Tax=Tasmannia lanceolata TaxID=3420 RepID=UPI00406375E2